ncbi:transposase [Streptomyces sp. G-G2]|uniref:transposase n=1 Tax=Streptomyces sp. G-G2 TaxID=3046201 RepID=UPI0024BA69DA|nr:transposase [Streptomyces sp. G-G2]
MTETTPYGADRARFTRQALARLVLCDHAADVADGGAGLVATGNDPDTGPGGRVSQAFQLIELAERALVSAVIGTGSRRSGRTQPYLTYLHQCWNEGCTDAARLCAEIRERGYRGSERTIRRSLQTLRASGKPAPTKPTELTVRKATWLITSHPDNLNENRTIELKKLLTRSPELEAVAACVRDFATMMAKRQGRDLDAWLVRAEATGEKPLLSLARGLRRDFAAVAAGLTLEWNSGKVEGNVNRIKRIKRDGYGRTGFDLLRLQILRAD